MQLPSAFEPLVPGDPPLIGGYRVLARLGADRVYLATTQSGRRLAVKLVRPEYTGDPEFRRRLRREVTAAQRVRSPRVAPVFDAHPDGPEPWVATEYVPGPSLVRAGGDGPLPADTVRVLLAGTAEALQAVHDAGVIHQGLKPSNVFLAPDGPRITDFGIARAAETASGTPGFVAPEQALGHDVTPAADVFALGGIALFAATGRVLSEERAPSEEPDLDGCPEPLLGLIERCLEKDPARRPLPREILAELGPLGRASGPSWLPTEIAERLPAYAAEPPRPAAPPSPTIPDLPHPPARPAFLPPAGPPPTAPGAYLAWGEARWGRR